MSEALWRNCLLTYCGTSFGCETRPSLWSNRFRNPAINRQSVNVNHHPNECHFSSTYSTLLRMISTPREHYLTSCATRAPLRIGIVVERLDRRSEERRVGKEC